MNRKITPGISQENGVHFVAPSSHPSWIRMPRQFGGDKKRVIDVYDIDACICGKHPTTIYELEDNYITCKCDINGYVFAQKKIK